MSADDFEKAVEENKLDDFFSQKNERHKSTFAKKD